MSGILWEEMVKQNMARSRGEVKRLVSQRAVRCEFPSIRYNFIADFDDLDLPGKTVIRVGKHMFRCVTRLNAEGFDQLRGRIEIPVTSPEEENGWIKIRLDEIQ